MGLLDLNADDADLPVGLPIEVRVKAGMALLDEKHGPDWVHRIDVDTLQLSSSCRCVLGQLSGKRDFVAEVERVLPESKYDEGRAASEHGFWLRLGELHGYNELTTAWRLAILARRMEAQ